MKWSLHNIDNLDVLISTHSLIVSNYQVEKKKYLKKIPELDADVSQAPWYVSSPSLLLNELCVLLLVWFAVVRPGLPLVGGRKREQHNNL